MLFILYAKWITYCLIYINYVYFNLQKDGSDSESESHSSSDGSQTDDPVDHLLEDGVETVVDDIPADPLQYE